MQERTRNVIVGLTVVLALVLLGVLVVMFTGLPQVFQTGYVIHIRFDHSGGVRAGDAVHMSGMQIGQITDVRFAQPGKPGAGVTMTARIDGNIRLPGNTQAHMYTQGLSGQPYVALQADGKALINETTGQPYELLPTDRAVTIRAKHEATNLAQEARDVGRRIESFLSDARPAMDAAAKLGQLADDAGPALRELTRLAENINALFATGEAAPSTSPATAPAATTTRPAPRTPMAKISRILDGLDGLFGDPESREKMSRTLDNLDRASQHAVASLKQLQTFSEDAREMVGSVRSDSHKLMQKLIASAEKISTLVETLQRSAARLDRGEGTAGKMLHDTELYENLVTASKQLTETLAQFNKLLEKWKADGVELKLK
ncbi:MAG: MCE family protein [Phycisphaerae bacterium]|nr:MCE family protein [Phycisphaerae bacterium]